MHYGINKILPSVFLVFFTLIFYGSESEAQGLYSGWYRLLYSPSARLNGMGESGVAITDEPSSWSNPAAPAMVVDRWNFTSSNYPGKMQWVPGSNDYTSTYNSFIIGGKMKSFSSAENEDAPSFLQGAIGYYRTSYKELERYEDRTETFSQSVENLSLSGGVNYYAQVMFGMAFKKVDFSSIDTSWYTEKGEDTVPDYGFMAKLPLVQIAERITGTDLSLGGLKSEFDVSAGVSWMNYQGSMDITDITKNGRYEFKSKFPQIFSKGMAVSFGSTYQGRIPINLFRCTLTRENGNVKGEFPLKRNGNEFWFFETVAVRDGTSERYFRLVTDGISFSSDGLMKAVAIYYGKRGGNRYIDYAARHFSFTWDRFHYQYFNSMKHSQFTVRFSL